MNRRETTITSAVLTVAIFLFGGLIVMGTAEAQGGGCGAVQRELAYGEAAIQDAKSRAGYLEAAKQYRAAIKKAPNCAAAHFNLGVAYEKAGRLSSAKVAFETYLKLAPKAKDAAKVRKSIFKLEYRIKKAGRTRRAAKKKPRQTRKTKTAAKPSSGWVSFSGRWCDISLCEHPRWGTPNRDYIVSISGLQIKIRFSNPRTTNLKHAKSYTGTIGTSGSMRGRLRVTAFVLRGACAGQTWIVNQTSFTGSLRRGDLMDTKGRIIRGKAMVLRYQSPAATDFDYSGCRAVPRQFRQISLVLKKR